MSHAPTRARVFIRTTGEARKKDRRLPLYDMTTTADDEAPSIPAPSRNVAASATSSSPPTQQRKPRRPTTVTGVSTPDFSPPTLHPFEPHFHHNRTPPESPRYTTFGSGRLLYNQDSISAAEKQRRTTTTSQQASSALPPIHSSPAATPPAARTCLSHPSPQHLAGLSRRTITLYNTNPARASRDTRRGPAATAATPSPRISHASHSTLHCSPHRTVEVTSLESKSRQETDPRLPTRTPENSPWSNRCMDKGTKWTSFQLQLNTVKKKK